MRTRFTVMLGMIAAMLFASGAVSGAVATPPVTMSSGFITDEAGVLTSSELAGADERLAALSDSGRGELFVVFVDQFTEPSTGNAWADETAIDNGLDVDQYLIAVAVEAGQYGISVDDNASLTDAQIDDILQAMRAELREGDWDGAVIAAADAFPGQGGADSGGIVWLVIVLLVVAAAIVIVVLIVRSRRKKQPTPAAIPDPNDPYASVSDEDLEKQAGSALVHADDAITSSRQELGFAVAQYGDESATSFTQVVEAAQAKVSEAFSLKQKIDDEIPDTAAQRRAWHIQIIQLCDQADDLLNENIEAFEQLRRLEADAPQALERVKTRRAAAQQTLAAAGPALAALTATYDAAALATVSDNPAQAAERLSLADSEIAEATGAISSGENGEAAFAIRTAEEAVEQSEQLVQAVTSLGANLASVEDQARAMIVDLEGDIAAAGAMPDDQAQLAPIVARTRANIDAAKQSLQGSSRNPQQVLENLERTGAEIDAVLGRAREAAQQAQREQRMLQQRLIQAQAQISAANDFFATRRGAIGATARTRLSEAGAAYSEALAAQTSDPARAAERATRANNLAVEALSYARSEVDAFTSGGWSGGYSRGSDLGGAILGGIIGGLFSGGGGGGGGGSWSSGGGWRSGGSSRGSRSRPSSFGGGSSRSSSRGGGRSRGGRF